MQVIPAIDIRGGSCVRLVQGDYARETVYGEDPVAVALEWWNRGAQRLHVVDLDGAREGHPVNRCVVAAIAQRVSVPIEVGGGIRTEDDARWYRESGVDRVIMGTSAVENRTLVSSLAQSLGPALAVGIDARDGTVRTRGWLQGGEISALELARTLEELGVARLIYTDISRDGMLQGPNVDALSAMTAAVKCPVIASGGIATVEHLHSVQRAGAEGAILGKALYEGTLSLESALLAVMGAIEHE